MKIIDESQVLNWLSQRNFLSSSNRILIPDYPFSYSFKITADSGVKTKISGAICTFFIDHHGESLLWIDEYGIWPSCEDDNLFNGFRKSIGEIEPVYIKPGHLFRTEDMANIQSIIAMILYFVQGAVIVTDSGDIVVRISHDEFIDIYSKNNVDISWIKNLCEDTD